MKNDGPPLTGGQLTRLGMLLDELLPLDPRERQRWLRTLPPEHQDLRPALERELPGRLEGLTPVEALATLPRFQDVDQPLAPASGLGTGNIIGRYRLTARPGVPIR